MKQPGNSLETKTRKLSIAEQKSITARITAVVMAELADESEDARSPITLGEIAEIFMKEHQHLKHSSLEQNKYILSAHLLPKFGLLDWTAVDAHAVAIFRSDLASTISGRRTNQVLSLLRRLTTFASARKLSDDTAGKLASMTSVRQEYTVVDPFKKEEVDNVLRCIRPRYRQFYALCAWTGARISEVIALRWRDIDFERKEMSINKARVHGVESTTKTPSSTRVVRLLQPALIALEMQKPYTFGEQDEYVFLNEKNNPLGKHQDEMWKRACVRSGVRHRPARQLRHSFASWCLEAGEDPSYIAALLGHSSPEVTFKYYARWIPNDNNGRHINASLRAHYKMAADQHASVEVDDTKVAYYLSPEIKAAMYVDPFDRFLNQCAVIRDDIQIEANCFFQAHIEWCREARYKPLVRNTFGRYMTARGFMAAKISRGRYKYLGIGLRSEPTQTLVQTPPRKPSVPKQPSTLELSILNVLQEHPEREFRLGDIWQAVNTCEQPASYGGIKKALARLAVAGHIQVVNQRLGLYALKTP